MEIIDRRGALKRTAKLMGGMISAPAMLSVLHGCAPDPELAWKPVFFTEDQAALVSEIAEGILPATDTPGAKELGVPQFIEEYVRLCYTGERKAAFMTGLDLFDIDCKKKYGRSFIDLTPEKREKFLLEENEKIFRITYMENAIPSFFWLIKEATLLGYCTSEKGATEVLQYQAIPGEYKGCIPLSEAGKGRMWATS